MLKLEVKGMEAFAKLIEDVSKLDDLGLKQVAARAHRDVIDHFNKEQGPKGKWKSTSRPNKILNDTGRLRNSGRFRVVDRSAVVTFGTAYARTHNEGDLSRNIEKRQFMYLSEKAASEINDFVAKKAAKKRPGNL